MKKFFSLFTVLLLMLTLIAAGCGEEAAATLTDGTYTGTGEGIAEMKIEVTVAGGEITDIEVVEQDETPDIGGAAFDTLIERALEAQSADIDAVSGATVTSEGFKTALEDALSQAK